MSHPPQRRALVRWIGLHLLAICAIGGTGCAAEWWRMGWNDAAALERVRAAVDGEFHRRTNRLRSDVATLVALPVLAEAVSRAPGTRPALFAILSALGPPQDDAAVTLYSDTSAVLAWRGQAADLPEAVLVPERTFFVVPGPLGWRLLYAESVRVTPSDETSARVGLIVAEEALTPAHAVDRTLATSFEFETPLGPVTLSPTRFATDAVDDTQFGFTVSAGTEGPLLEGRIERTSVSEHRRQWRTYILRLTSAYLGVAALLGMMAWCRSGGRRGHRHGMWGLAGVAASGAFARWMLHLAVPDGWRRLDLGAASFFPTLEPRTWLGSPIDLAITMLVLTATIVASTPWLRSCRGFWPYRATHPWDRPTTLAFVVLQLLGGAALAAVLLGVWRIVHDVAHTPELGAFEWSFLTLSPLRLLVLGGLMLMMTAASWGAAAILRLVISPFRRTSSRSARGVAVLLWTVPVLALLVSRETPLSTLAWLTAIAAAVSLASIGVRLRGRGWASPTSQAHNVLARYSSVWVPVLLLYPGLHFEADQARRDIVAHRYATQVMTHPQQLQARLNQTLAQIDEVVSRELVEPLNLAEAPATTGPALLLWRRTALAADRLTSAIELYGANGTLVSRFALNFPEYAVTDQKFQGRSCQWEVFGETTAFGATERRMLHAERGICVETPGRPPTVVAGIVVHVMLDYPVLSFISSPDPYAAFLGSGRAAPTDPVLPDTVLAIYGWGRSAVYSSANLAWPLDDALFTRIVEDAKRESFWEVRSLANRDYDVFFSNDRQGIYAIGVPRHTWFDHFVFLSELTTLAGVLFLAGLVVSFASKRTPGAAGQSALEVMAEIRRSFYRKLFLAFVGASVVPVIVLAVLVRTYVAGRWRADIEAEAARTAAVAQRVIEESLDLQPAIQSAVTLTDDVMVWISRIIDQDVNIFGGPTLLATSERDLFESGLLPTRVSAEVFEAIAVNRLPNYVGEDRIAGLRYLTAAVPIRLGSPDTILTVPLALRQQETERKIQELDRGVNLAALVFVMLGAAGGFWMAERIGDPVRRLTRATRRLASGDLSVRAMVKSSDELERLVEDFNRMAEQLAQQRSQLERTHRLEAWADVARQVAHDIKNPLTPIQLSAEHLRRVNRDRGQPLSPVLESCVDSILGQVRLLRQISSEFSSFASTPTARLVPASLSEVLHEAVDPYHDGLAPKTQIVWDLPESLPMLLVDRTLLGRAIINIVDNALHAMPAGGTLSISARPEGSMVAIVVADTGMGMDQEGVERLFEPYFSTKTTGTGLGLTIAKRNVELHGGSISVTSALGHGTQVRILLPMPPSRRPSDGPA